MPTRSPNPALATNQRIRPCLSIKDSPRARHPTPFWLLTGVSTNKTMATTVLHPTIAIVGDLVTVIKSDVGMLASKRATLLLHKLRNSVKPPHTSCRHSFHLDQVIALLSEAPVSGNHQPDSTVGGCRVPGDAFQSMPTTSMTQPQAARGGLWVRPGRSKLACINQPAPGCFAILFYERREKVEMRCGNAFMH